MHPTLIRFIGAMVFALGIVRTAHADTPCVDSDIKLLTALTSGSFQQTPLKIRLVKGSYTISSSLNLFFATPVAVEGGYTAGCVGRSPNAANTSIDFSGQDVSFYQQVAHPVASVRLDGLTIKNGKNFFAVTGRYNELSSDDSGEIRLSRVRLAGFSHGITLIAYNGNIDVTNSQFDNLGEQDLDLTGCSVLLTARDSGRMSVEFSTFDLTSNLDLCMQGAYIGSGSGNGESYAAEVANSVIWSSDGTTGTIFTSVYENDFDTFTLNLINVLTHTGISGTATVTETNSLYVDPQWVSPGAGDYHLGVTSPALNSGLAIPNGPATDIEGKPRPVGFFPDRGAYESQATDPQDFVVTSLLDDAPNDPHQLRGAINAANANANASVIKFAIPPEDGSGCPHVIKLNTPLPPITSPVTISGYSQPGSSRTSDDETFDGILCVVIQSADGVGTLTTGLRVPPASPNAKLAVSGIGFGGFAQAVLLQGGAGHEIKANQFGGHVYAETPPGLDLVGATSYGISVGGAGGNNLMIGGVNVEDRNLIDGGATGIKINSDVVSTPQTCNMINNLIGLRRDGVAAAGNGIGIDISGDGCRALQNRIAASTNMGIRITAGGSGNWLQANRLGYDVNGGAKVNNKAIVIESGDDNRIGTLGSGEPLGSLLGNTIHYNGGAGIWMQGGMHNTVRTNTFVDIDPVHDALDIDLGGDGPTDNDPLDPDTGVNGLQNFPAITSMSSPYVTTAQSTNVPVQIRGTIATAPGSYHIDAYFSDYCSSVGRGSAQVYLGSKIANVDATGTGTFTFGTVILPHLRDGFAVSLTATDPSGSTSELGGCAHDITATDQIFQDGFEDPNS